MLAAWPEDYNRVRPHSSLANRTLEEFRRTIRVDRGTECVLCDLDLWTYANGVILDFLRSGKPTDNSFIEPFNGQRRAECLRHDGESAPSHAIAVSWSLMRQVGRASLGPSSKTIYAAGTEAAYHPFRQLRGSETNGDPLCPRCRFSGVGLVATRRKFKCKACPHQFSMTSSGTISTSHKLAFIGLRGAIALVPNADAAKGVSALQLERTIVVLHQTAVVLLHKPPEAMLAETEGLILSGTVQVDGAVVSGHVPSMNRTRDSTQMSDTRGRPTCQRSDPAQ